MVQSVGSSDTPVNYKTTRRYIAEEPKLHFCLSHSCCMQFNFHFLSLYHSNNCVQKLRKLFLFASERLLRRYWVIYLLILLREIKMITCLKNANFKNNRFIYELQSPNYSQCSKTTEMFLHFCARTGFSLLKVHPIRR
jgi:hypothetical protein